MRVIDTWAVDLRIEMLFVVHQRLVADERLQKGRYWDISCARENIWRAKDKHKHTAEPTKQKQEISDCDIRSARGENPSSVEMIEISHDMKKYYGDLSADAGLEG